jgi:transposase
MLAGMIVASRKEKYEQMRDMLNEKQWRQYLALEAQEGGSVMQVAQEAGVSYNTVLRGLRELEGGQRYSPGDRQRKEGGGRKQAVEKDASLLPDLESLLEPKGDPMSLLKWTTKSVTHLKETLEQMGHEVSQTTIRRILHALDYSLRANKKNIEGPSHPDREGQFAHIQARCREFEGLGNPIISVDCKKKELIGLFKNNGTEWVAKGERTEVSVYDFASLSDGKAIPYGVYDLIANQGFVNVGIDHDTAEFAVESIRRWWQEWGRVLYPDKKALLITADGCLEVDHSLVAPLAIYLRTAASIQPW